MDCTVESDAAISEKLLAYHLGTCTEAEKAAIETHLLACTACLRAAMVLKVALDRGEDGPRPSEWVRKRLRADVEKAFKTSAPARARAWFQRPIPLYQGLCAAAVAVLVGALAPRFFASSGAQIDHAPRVFAPARERVDTSRAASESLTIY
jgi:hypothetical protein